jgi:hypothetical protein
VAVLNAPPTAEVAESKTSLFSRGEAEARMVPAERKRTVEVIGAFMLSGCMWGMRTTVVVL